MVGMRNILVLATAIT